MPPNTARHNDRCASLLGQGCDCRSPWDDEDDSGAMPDIVDVAATNPAVGRSTDGAALLNMIVGDFQTADPQWRDARVVGHMRMFNGELRWIMERPDGTQHRVVAVAVQEDWQTPIPHGVGVNDV